MFDPASLSAFFSNFGGRIGQIMALYMYTCTFELKRAKKIWLDMTIEDDLEAFEQCSIVGVDI